MMRLAGENLFGMSHFLRVEDPSSPRGYTQGAAVCLSRLPFFGMILQRLHSFSTDVIDRTACADEMVALAADLRNTRSRSWVTAPFTRCAVCAMATPCTCLHFGNLLGSGLLRCPSGIRCAAV
ncbi:unnamed protein product [Ascophyllum nodosum]